MGQLKLGDPEKHTTQVKQARARAKLSLIFPF